jgi:ribosome biogenesis GTPase A
MAAEFKNTRLWEFCQKATTAVDELQKLLDVPRAVEPKEITNRLSILRGRLKRPEVRILILGPLKSGKSTLMNVLTVNPRVSQINQLPAYPCVVEVRDIDRGEDETSGETSTFYKHGTSEEPIALAEGVKKLDTLLHDYICDGKSALIMYDRVVQKVNLSLTQEDLNLVLVDSPGLIFGKKGYSEETQNLLTESDVVIFVIRPEQLFFQIIEEYLNNFVQHAANRRVFILVNATTRAKTLKNDVFVDCDQIEMKKELLEYFYKHIAGTELNAELRIESNISVHFADLYVAGAASFDGDGSAKAQYTPLSDTRVSVERIQNYLRHEDLAAKKERNLGTLFNDITKLAKEFLQAEEKKATEAQQVLEVQIQEQKNTVTAYMAHKGKCESEIAKINQELRAAELRLAKLADGTEPETISKDWFSSDTSEGFAVPDEGSLREQCEKVYVRWSEGKLGTRDLHNLDRVIWAEGVVDGRESLEDQYRAVVNHIYQQGLTKAREAVSDGCLRAALLCQEMSAPLHVSPKPPSGATQLSPLQFPPERRFWTLHWIGYGPTDLWGKDGHRVLDRKIDNEILNKQRDHFIGQIVHAPWAIKDCFSPRHLFAISREVFIHRLLPLLKAKLSEYCSDLQIRAAESAKRLAETTTLFTQARDEKENAERQLRDWQIHIADLQRRHAQLGDIALN